MQNKKYNEEKTEIKTKTVMFSGEKLELHGSKQKRSLVPMISLEKKGSDDADQIQITNSVDEEDEDSEDEPLPPLGKPITKASSVLERAQSRIVYSTSDSDDKVEETYQLVPESKLRELFGKVQQKDSTISLPQFLNLLSELDADFSEAEAKRIFAQLDYSGYGKINFFQFLTGVNCRKLLKVVVGNYFFRSKFAIPSNYDYSKQTVDNYKADHMHFIGEFSDIRSTRDYSYHLNLIEERQLLQDDIIKNVVIRTEPQARPWILFTCGPMGAGKSFALSWMSQHGVFPLENIVRIDPDRFKSIMPEWKGYLEKNASDAGGLCHRESAFMVEIAQEYALRKSQHIWVDGSLRDGKWYAQIFDDIRFRFPQYRIAIFYVYASERAVRKRIEMRAISTGRTIPEHLIKASLESPDHSLAVLTPKSDFVARINTEHPVPVLEAFEFVDCSKNWEVVRKRFGQVHPSSNEFPRSLAPFYLERTTYDDSFFKWQEKERNKLIDMNNYSMIKVNMDLDFFSRSKNLAFLMELVANQELITSPAHPINLDEENRQLGNIPPEAHFFVWVYPSAFIAVENLKLRNIDIRDPHVAFLLIGGFVYFDLNDSVVAVNAVCAGAQKHLLQFGPAEHFPLEAVKSVSKRRWHPVTLPHLRQKGARYFAWILPGEKIRQNSSAGNLNCVQSPCHRRMTRYGGFAYLFHDLDNDTHSDYSEAEAAKNCIFPIIC